MRFSIGAALTRRAEALATEGLLQPGGPVAALPEAAIAIEQVFRPLLRGWLRRRRLRCLPGCRLSDRLYDLGRLALDLGGDAGLPQGAADSLAKQFPPRLAEQGFAKQAFLAQETLLAEEARNRLGDIGDLIAIGIVVTVVGRRGPPRNASATFRPAAFQPNPIRPASPLGEPLPGDETQREQKQKMRHAKPRSNRQTQNRREWGKR